VSITGAATLSTATDLTGSFEFSSVPPGVIALTASLLGYQNVSGNATISGGQTLCSPGAVYDERNKPTTDDSSVPLSSRDRSAARRVTVALNGARQRRPGATGGSTSR